MATKLFDHWRDAVSGAGLSVQDRRRSHTGTQPGNCRFTHASTETRRSDDRRFTDAPAQAGRDGHRRFTDATTEIALYRDRRRRAAERHPESIQRLLLVDRAPRDGVRVELRDGGAYA
jgi:hypothetical protein